MPNPQPNTPHQPPRHHRARAYLLTISLITLLTGCAALTNPVANGIPVRLLPPEVVDGPRREDMRTVPLNLLKQPPPEVYRLASGDTLGIFIDTILPGTSSDQLSVDPPVYFPSRIDPIGAGLPPSLGFPIPVRGDGTVALPLVDPINVDGLSVEEATEKIRQTYLDKKILATGRERIIVSVMQPRQTRVLVFRQELGGFAQGGRGDIAAGSQKRGTGQIVDLRAYENDVLTALANSGGLPGLDVFDEIIVFKGGQHDHQLTSALESLPHDEDPEDTLSRDTEVIHIPTRWPKGEPLPFSPQDVVLDAGDVVFVEARDFERFYTGGLLPAGERVLPRDIDLDVVEAVALAQGALINGGFGGNNLSGTIINPGMGQASPSLLSVIRRLPDGQQINIKVDLNRAIQDSRERILVRPNDILILQETQGEAIARYFTQTLDFAFFGQLFERGGAQGDFLLTAPQPVLNR